MRQRTKDRRESTSVPAVSRPAVPWASSAYAGSSADASPGPDVHSSATQQQFSHLVVPLA
jgi:hypothetical protein